MAQKSVQKSTDEKNGLGRSARVGFFYGIGTLQFLDALQKGFIDLRQDFVHLYERSPANSIYLTPIVPGGADAVSVCAHLNSMHAHGRELFGFDYDFSRVDYLIQSIHEYNSQHTHPREIKRSLYEFKKQCMLNGIDKSKILPYLQLVKLTFRGFILEFKREILAHLVVESEEELYKNSEYRFQFMSNQVPFTAIQSYTGIGALEDRFTSAYYELLDAYKREVAQVGHSKKAKQVVLKEFYLGQSQLIRELKMNIDKQYMIKYE